MAYAELAPRRQQFCVAPSYATVEQRSSVDIEKRVRYTVIYSCDMSAASLLGSREQRYTKTINNSNEIQTYKGFRITLCYRTKHKANFRGNSPFLKLQNDT